MARWLAPVCCAVLFVACGEVIEGEVPESSDAGEDASGDVGRLDAGEVDAPVAVDDAASDASEDVAPAPCSGACTGTTVCNAELERCDVETPPTCAAPIAVLASGGRFAGSLCGAHPVAELCSGQSAMSIAVFLIGNAPMSVSISTIGTGPVHTNVVSSSCESSPSMGCSTFGAGGNTAVKAGVRFAIGAALPASSCLDYDITFTPQ